MPDPFVAGSNMHPAGGMVEENNVPNPKRKFSNARRDKRRSNWKITAPTLVRCGNCEALHVPHHVCPSCGTYGSNHRQVVNLRRSHSA